MISEIPTSAEFHAAGLNQLYLAWHIAMQVARDHEEVEELHDHLDKNEAAAAATEYWTKSQPALANAFGLVQQAMEMALKGRIAAISPFLLIARDPKDWPGHVETRPIPFSEFRTLDAADLVKVHNTFAAAPLNNDFRTFWENVRRDRNKLMHSVPAKTFEPADLIRSILTAAEALFSDKRWPQVLLDMERDGAFAAYGLSGDYDYNHVMGQIDIAIRNLTPAEIKRFLGFDKGRRAYICPACLDRANRDWQEEWPALAQLRSRSSGETRLYCVVCNETAEVVRINCVGPECKGNVIHEMTCLTCLSSQDC
jgi:hypothetical protein